MKTKTKISLSESIGLLIDYSIKIKNSKMLDFEKKSIYAKIKHYINIINKVDNIINELKK